MPTEAEAGDVLVKLVRANHEVAKNKDRNLGLHQGGEDCHGLKEKSIIQKRQYPEHSS